MKEMTPERTVYSATEAREKFSDLFDAAHFGQRVVVRKRGREVAMISIEMLERLEKLAELEAALDSREALDALAEFQQQGGKTMKQIKQELGMD